MSEFGLAALTIAAVVYGASAISKLRSRQAFSAFRAGLSETALIPAARLRVAAATLAGAESAIAASAAAAVVTGAFLRGANVLAMAALVVLAWRWTTESTVVIATPRPSAVSRAAGRPSAGHEGAEAEP